MCLAVYLASSIPLNEISWNKKLPAFYLTKLSNKDRIGKQFKLPHFYYLGAHTGCGCGFIKDGNIGDDLKKCNANYSALAKAMNGAENQKATMQIFSCWEGDQDKAPESVVSRAIFQLEEPKFEFKELQLINIEPNLATAV